MDCSYIEERNRLARTIALLLSLAFMAARAAFSPARNHRELINIIRAAEAAGLRLAAGYGGWQEGIELPDIGDGYTRDDALRLAVSLRATAMALWFHLQRFDAYSAAVREWVAPDTLKAGSRRFIANQQHQCRAKVPLIDTTPDPPRKAAVIKHAIAADLPLPGEGQLPNRRFAKANSRETNIAFVLKEKNIAPCPT